MQPSILPPASCLLASSPRHACSIVWISACSFPAFPQHKDPSRGGHVLPDCSHPRWRVSSAQRRDDVGHPATTTTDDDHDDNGHEFGGDAQKPDNDCCAICMGVVRCCCCCCCCTKRKASRPTACPPLHPRVTCPSRGQTTGDGRSDNANDQTGSSRCTPLLAAPTTHQQRRPVHVSFSFALSLTPSFTTRLLTMPNPPSPTFPRIEWPADSTPLSAAARAASRRLGTDIDVSEATFALALYDKVSE